MRQKLLLLLMMVSFGALYAQTDTIRSLIISEVRYDRADMAYVEFTNMGDAAVNLGEFEFLTHTPYTTFPDGAFWPTEPHRLDGRWLMLPDGVLEPGESYVIAAFHDWVEEQYAKDVAMWGYSEDYGTHTTKPNIKPLTDLQWHRTESPNNDPTDSISEYNALMDTWGGGRDVYYLRHHPPGADSCVVDQVGGVFTDENGSNPDNGYHDVAGFSQATGYAVLVRRFDVKQGNLTFVRGNDLSESEWIPIPFLRESNDTYETWRDVFWTVGNHGNTNLDEATLTSSTVDIDWTSNVLTVPYGYRNDDSLIYAFDYTPGLAWHYHYNDGENASADSAYASVRTGDSITIYAVGDDLDVIKFHIEAAPPTADANWVVPMRRRGVASGEFPENGEVYEVSHYMMDGVLDTISEIPFGTRVDSLYKYLEKPELASWEIVWVDGNERPDLMNGDKLKVSAEDGSEKEYFLKLQEYRKAKNAYLSSITWPDIPEDYKGIFGWVGDTIPEFNRGKTDYKVTVPWDVDGIPALVGKNEDDNASHSVQRATNLAGAVEDRTVSITAVAENDTTVLTYNIILEKEKNLDDVQPWAGEPFISQFTWKSEYSHTLVEIVNPGTEVLDLSDYMFFCGYENDPAAAIAGWDVWEDRYVKYIPGYKWEDEADWTVQRHIAVADVNINPNVYPGDVFVMSEINKDAAGLADYLYFDQIDVDFRNPPWSDEPYTGATAVYQWLGMNFYMWRIDNDSIKQGLKPATDPNDFTLIEVFGMGDGSDFAPIGVPSGQVSSYTRKTDIFLPNPEFQGSFGGDADSSEWILTDENVLKTKGYGWPAWRTNVPEGTGSHFMDEVTVYRSTVASLVYKVSPGFTMEEEIRGLVDGTTAEVLEENLIKAHAEQALKVIAVADGAELELADVVLNGDTLVVISADSTNVTKYILEVTAEGLSDDALLTSSMYTIDADGETGSVSGFDYGLPLRDVVNGVDVPLGAEMTVVDADDAYVPLQILNYDTVYVDVLVSDQIFFDVVAEDGATSILYQLMPNSDPSDAFVTSDVYSIDQMTLLISLVPQGINVDAFLAKLTPAPGASVQLFDKLGYERNEGLIYMDDKLLVSSADGSVMVTYFLSVLNEVPNYLAYVVSDVYLVDEENLSITQVDVAHSVADFKGNLTPAEGASMEVQNSTGSMKADSDIMAEGDMLVVVAGNGVNQAVYTIALATAVNDEFGSLVNIYPNPSKGILNIAGAEIGSRVRVYNSVGVNVRDIVVYSGVESISLEDQSAGLFLITISLDDEIKGQYKLIKQ
ncbi:MAG: T9SS type A sorting domain-containing protein [Bacteroides sp.]|nr:T9SS type A sorting domain-containing protein [Bacteroides sp.]